MQFRDKLKVDLPAWHHSDSTNSAVAVGKLLGLQCLRCVVHVLAIAAQMVLWEQFKTEKNTENITWAECRGAGRGEMPQLGIVPVQARRSDH